jgi:GrpB-like predicted nucleotidyltransferase (UPF0157 family)
MNRERSAFSLVVCDYSETWPVLFEQLAKPLRQMVAPIGGRLEHVGSTSVPGLAAKPIIDMDIVVALEEVVNEAITAAVSLGYVHQGDKGIAGREAFMWPAAAPPHHLYVVVEGSKPHRDHVDLRDYLRADPDAASRYAELKRELAVRFADDREAYTNAKDEFINQALERSRSERR